MKKSIYTFIAFFLLFTVVLTCLSDNIVGFMNNSSVVLSKQQSLPIWINYNSLLTTAYPDRYSYWNVWDGVIPRNYAIKCVNLPLMFCHARYGSWAVAVPYDYNLKAHDFSAYDHLSGSDWWRVYSTNMANPTSMTVSAWVYFVKPLTNHQAICAVSDATAGTPWCGIRNNGKIYGSFMQLYVSPRSAYGGITLTTGTWYNLIFTITKPASIHQYVNGIYDVTGRVGSTSHDVAAFMDRFSLLGASHINLRFRGKVRNLVLWHNYAFASNDPAVAFIYNSGPYADISSYPYFSYVKMYAFTRTSEHRYINDAPNKWLVACVYTNKENYTPYTMFNPREKPRMKSVIASSSIDWKTYAMPTYKNSGIDTGTPFVVQCWSMRTSTAVGGGFFYEWNGSKGWFFGMANGNMPYLVISDNWPNRGWAKCVTNTIANIQPLRWDHIMFSYDGKNRTDSFTAWINGIRRPIRNFNAVASPCLGSIKGPLLIYSVDKAFGHNTYLDMCAIWTNKTFTDADVWNQFWAREQAVAHGWNQWCYTYRNEPWLTNNMVLYFPFEHNCYANYSWFFGTNNCVAGGSGNTFIEDVINEPDRFLRFTGSGYAKILHHNSLNLGTNLWVYMQWVRKMTSSTGAKALFSKRAYNGAGVEVILDALGVGTNVIYLRDNSTTNILYGSFITNLAYNAWYAVIVGRSGATSLFARVNNIELPINYINRYNVNIDCNAPFLLGASASTSNLSAIDINEITLVKGTTLSNGHYSNYYLLSREGTTGN